jgi:hypothetical protein
LKTFFADCERFSLPWLSRCPGLDVWAAGERCAPELCCVAFGAECAVEPRLLEWPELERYEPPECELPAWPPPRASVVSGTTARDAASAAASTCLATGANAITRRPSRSAPRPHDLGLAFGQRWGGGWRLRCCDEQWLLAAALATETALAKPDASLGARAAHECRLLAPRALGVALGRAGRGVACDVPRALRGGLLDGEATLEAVPLPFFSSNPRARACFRSAGNELAISFLRDR